MRAQRSAEGKYGFYQKTWAVYALVVLSHVQQEKLEWCRVFYAESLAITSLYNCNTTGPVVQVIIVMEPGG